MWCETLTKGNNGRSEEDNSKGDEERAGRTGYSVGESFKTSEAAEYSVAAEHAPRMTRHGVTSDRDRVEGTATYR